MRDQEWRNERSGEVLVVRRRNCHTAHCGVRDIADSRYGTCVVTAEAGFCEECYPAWAKFKAGTVHKPMPDGCKHECHKDGDLVYESADAQNALSAKQEAE